MRRLHLLLIAVALGVAACGGGSGGDGPLASGRSVYRSACASCHGTVGQGGTGPGLGNVIATFPDCADQIEWIALGSSAWRDVNGPTYGAAGRPVAGGMPSFAGSRSEADLQAVSAFVRVEYGGGREADALSACLP